jgi:hypothetical protein
MFIENGGDGMEVPTKHIYLAVGCGLLAVVVVTAAWVSSEMDRSRAQARAEARDLVIQNLEEAKHQREVDLAKVVAGLETQIASIKTAPAATRVIERLVPSEQGQTAPLTRAQLPPDVAAALPESPGGYVARTAEGEIALAKEQLNCEQDRARLGTCTATKAMAEQQREEAEKKAQDWERAAGHTKGQRARNCLLRGGIGAAGGGLSGKGKLALGGLALGIASCWLVKP